MGGMASTALSASIVDATTFGPTEGFRLTHDQSDLGSSVAGIGDINDDGYDDVAVGAPGVDHGSGMVYIMLGKPDNWKKKENTKKAMPIVSSLRRGALGSAVAGAGDINNDGRDDILIVASNG